MFYSLYSILFIWTDRVRNKAVLQRVKRKEISYVQKKKED